MKLSSKSSPAYGQPIAVADDSVSEFHDEVSILVVDDSPVVRRYITKSLSAEYNLVEAGSYLEASMYLRHFSFSLVVTDVVLPDISGIELLRMIISSHPDTRVIVVSGEGLEKGGKIAVEEGAICFLTKPFKPESLRRAVALALASRGARPSAD